VGAPALRRRRRPGDLLLSEGNNARFELIGTRALKSGVVMLSDQALSTTQGAPS